MHTYHDANKKFPAACVGAYTWQLALFPFIEGATEYNGLRIMNFGGTGILTGPIYAPAGTDASQAFLNNGKGDMFNYHNNKYTIGKSWGAFQCPSSPRKSITGSISSGGAMEDGVALPATVTYACNFHNYVCNIGNTAIAELRLQRFHAVVVPWWPAHELRWRSVPRELERHGDPDLPGDLRYHRRHLQHPGPLGSGDHPG